MRASRQYDLQNAALMQMQLQGDWEFLVTKNSHSNSDFKCLVGEEMEVASGKRHQWQTDLTFLKVQEQVALPL